MMLLHRYATYDLHNTWPRHLRDEPPQACHIMAAADHVPSQPGITRERVSVTRVLRWWLTRRKALA
jgi:hypothetical protein